MTLDDELDEVARREAAAIVRTNAAAAEVLASAEVQEAVAKAVAALGAVGKAVLEGAKEHALPVLLALLKQAALSALESSGSPLVKGLGGKR